MLTYVCIAGGVLALVAFACRLPSIKSDMAAIKKMAGPLKDEFGDNRIPRLTARERK